MSIQPFTLRAASPEIAHEMGVSINMFNILMLLHGTAEEWTSSKEEIFFCNTSNEKGGKRTFCYPIILV